MWHVYVDFTEKTGVFYVGKGTDRRVLDKNRNVKHNKIWNKLDGKRAIVKSFEHEVDAYRYEQMLIWKYGTFVDSMWSDESACNFTTGGDSFFNAEIVKNKIRMKALARQHDCKTKQRLRMAKLGIANTLESKAKNSQK